MGRTRERASGSPGNYLARPSPHGAPPTHDDGTTRGADDPAAVSVPGELGAELSADLVIRYRGDLWSAPWRCSGTQGHSGTLGHSRAGLPSFG